jgi:hypothetical protein
MNPQGQRLKTKAERITELEVEQARLRSHIHSLRAALRTVQAQLPIGGQSSLYTHINLLLRAWEKGEY